MHKIIDYLVEELTQLEEKIDRTGELSKSDLQCGDIQAHFLKDILACEGMLNSSYSRDMNYSGARRRDGMGRYMDSGPSYDHSYDEGRSMSGGYSSRRYSRDEGKSQMMTQLEELMQKARTSEEREVMQDALDRLQKK